jgi:hypothetical protein
MRTPTVQIVLAPFLFGACVSVDAASLSLSHPYGEFIDHGEVTAHYSTGDGRHGCNPSPTVVRSGRQITITSRRLAASVPIELCPDVPKVTIGELEVGWWTVFLQFFESDGVTPADSTKQEVFVHKPSTSCNQFPSIGSSLIVLHNSSMASPVIDRLAHDPSYALALGSPISTFAFRIGAASQYVSLAYPPLTNPNDMRAQVEATGDFLSVEVNAQGCFATPPADALGEVIEFYHEGLDHYFYSSDPNEIGGLDSGSGAKGWVRTGQKIRVLLAPGCPPGAHEQNAYRFYGRPGIGPDTHFFTVDRQECRLLDKNALWQYESAPFWATPPDSHGACTWVGELPLYRIWRPFGVSNHRFTTERSIVDEMKGRGWVDEGIAMCVKRPV